jgi:hypothetical protein
MNAATSVVIMAGGRVRCFQRNAGGIPLGTSDTTWMSWLVGVPGMVPEVLP